MMAPQTEPPSMSNPPAMIVEQADRDAAAAFYETGRTLYGPSDTCDITRSGRWDDLPLVQLLARHRTEAISSEIAAIVAWMRECAANSVIETRQQTLLSTAEAIEAGVYREDCEAAEGSLSSILAEKKELLERCWRLNNRAEAAEAKLASILSPENVEKAARAICERSGVILWEDTTEELREVYRSMARAALEAVQKD